MNWLGQDWLSSLISHPSPRSQGTHQASMIWKCSFGPENLKSSCNLNTFALLNWIPPKKNVEYELWEFCYQHLFFILFFFIYKYTAWQLQDIPKKISGKLDEVSKAFLFAILLVNLRAKIQLKLVSSLTGDKALGQVWLSPQARLQVRRMPEKEASCSILIPGFSKLFFLCL